MLYALDLTSQKNQPTRSGQTGLCPLCKSPVVAKCGDIVVWHWSHLSDREDCDPWAESLTEWHITWQKLLQKRRNAETEVTITRNGISHRADAVLPDGKVVELQHCTILPEQIREREDFYGENMFWIFDAREAFKNLRINLFKSAHNVNSFRWKHPRKSLSFAERKIYLDLGEGYLFEIEQFYQGPPCRGVGVLHHSDYLQDHTKD